MEPVPQNPIHCQAEQLAGAVVSQFCREGRTEVLNPDEGQVIWAAIRANGYRPVGIAAGEKRPTEFRWNAEDHPEWQAERPGIGIIAGGLHTVERDDKGPKRIPVPGGCLHFDLDLHPERAKIDPQKLFAAIRDLPSVVRLQKSGALTRFRGDARGGFTLTVRNDGAIWNQMPRWHAEGVDNPVVGLDVLAAGMQSVGFAIHPSGVPYLWRDNRSPATAQLADLPMAGVDDLARLIEELNGALRAFGLGDKPQRARAAKVSEELRSRRAPVPVPDELRDAFHELAKAFFTNAGYRRNVWRNYARIMNQLGDDPNVALMRWREVYHPSEKPGRTLENSEADAIEQMEKPHDALNVGAAVRAFEDWLPTSHPQRDEWTKVLEKVKTAAKPNVLPLSAEDEARRREEIAKAGDPFRINVADPKRTNAANFADHVRERSAATLKATKVEWLVDKRLWRSGTAFLAGLPYGGKTAAGVDLVVACVAPGSTSWANGLLREDRSRHALYIALEGEETIRAAVYAALKARGIEGAAGDDCAARIRVLLWSDKGPRFLANELEAAKSLNGRYDCVILDTWSKLGAVGDNNSADEVARAIADLERLAKQYETSIVVLDHVAKHGEDPTPRGSGAKMADTDATIVVRNGALSFEKVKGAPQPPPSKFEIVGIDLGKGLSGPAIRWGSEGAADAREGKVALGSVIDAIKREIALGGVTTDPKQFSNGGVVDMSDSAGLARSWLENKGFKPVDVAEAVFALSSETINGLASSAYRSDPERAKGKKAVDRIIGAGKAARSGNVVALLGAEWAMARQKTPAGF